MLLTGTLHVLTMLVALAGQFTFQIVPVLHLKLRAHGLDRSLHGAIVYATLGEVCTQLFILLLLLTKLQHEGVVLF
jgi:hypothetical protein